MSWTSQAVHLQGASHWTGSIHRFTIIEISTRTCMECLMIVTQTVKTQVMTRVGHVTSCINTQGRLGGGACRQKVAGSRCAGGLCIKNTPHPYSTAAWQIAYLIYVSNSDRSKGLVCSFHVPRPRQCEPLTFISTGPWDCSHYFSYNITIIMGSSSKSFTCGIHKYLMFTNHTLLLNTWLEICY